MSAIHTDVAGLLVLAALQSLLMFHQVCLDSVFTSKVHASIEMRCARSQGYRLTAECIHSTGCMRVMFFSCLLGCTRGHQHGM